eukprot:305589-Pyramimonas_sp.AAC.1
MRFEICAFGTKSARRWPLTVSTSDTLGGCLIKVMETSGLLPAQIAVVLMYIIPKVPVGARPIGAFCVPYR